MGVFRIVLGEGGGVVSAKRTMKKGMLLGSHIISFSRKRAVEKLYVEAKTEKEALELAKSILEKYLV